MPRPNSASSWPRRRQEQFPRGGGFSAAHRENSERVRNAGIARIQLARVRQGHLRQPHASAICFDEGEGLVCIGVVRVALEYFADGRLRLVELLLVSQCRSERVEQARVF